MDWRNLSLISYELYTRCPIVQARISLLKEIIILSIYESMSTLITIEIISLYYFDTLLK